MENRNAPRAGHMLGLLTAALLSAALWPSGVARADDSAPADTSAPSIMSPKPNRQPAPHQSESPESDTESNR